MDNAPPDTYDDNPQQTAPKPVWLTGLNAPQEQAVTTLSGPLLVLSGAGTGKTRVLTSRLAQLVASRTAMPWNILAVTFTNKAAREMKQRIADLVGPMSEQVMLGTFHSLAARMLRKHAELVGLKSDFTILDTDDQIRLIKQLMDAEGLDIKRWPPRALMAQFGSWKDRGLGPDKIGIADAGDIADGRAASLYKLYQQRLKTLNAADFGDLLLHMLTIFTTHQDVLESYQNRLTHIMVDEYQDTNVAQYLWLRLLAQKHNNLCCVGDDDQSIYGWRGAEVGNILKFEKDYPKAVTVRLEQNYRSTSNILNAANAVISKNAERLGKSLWTDSGEGEPIALYAAFNEHDEARYIADRLQSWVNQGNLREDSAILYRSNAQSRVLEAALLQADIPYRIYGGQRFYERLEIKNALSYLRLMMNCHDDVAFERVVNVPPRGIGDRTVETIRALAREEQISMWRASEKIVTEKRMPGRAINAVAVFLELINEMSGQLDELELYEQAENAIQRSGLIEMHKREKGERGQARVENLEELVGACRNFEAEDKDLPILPQFLDQVALDSGDRQADEDQDAVQLMTLHSAKGLEFPLVFIAGVEENLFPHKMSLDEPGRLEEERRLAYVGITRAMQKLYLTFAESRSIYGTESFNSVSRFVRDIPKEVIEEVRLQNTISRPTSYASKGSGGLMQSDSGDDTGFSLGQGVNHQVYGEGVILNFEGNGPRARVHVRFADVGTKILILASANLAAL